MQQFLFPRRPLSRGTLLFCHLLMQLGLAAGAALWLAPRTPWLAPLGWAEAWPALSLGGGLWLLATVALRLVAELLLLPHHLAGSLGAGPVITRSWERRPAVHDSNAAWTSDARAMDTDDSTVGTARVRHPAERLRPREPSLDLGEGMPRESER
ncbi:MAG: hypothetical protein IBX53_01570 [Halomonas sp.]|uniref:hypothetical protein n=1 Tax=Halomonas sp. TaxID=1486246 RepID=UPI001A0E8C4A|nr:hypothetical protein [Halomonas sp.]MBE0487741.1 hypothetical protein [Halomonas sp.]